MPLHKRIRFFLNYFFGPVLFVVMAFSIYKQIGHHTEWHQQWQIIQTSFRGEMAWRLYAVIALMLLNWGIEARKWQVLLRQIKKVSFTIAYRSVLAGLAFTMITPNRMGEFIGRVFYVPNGQRIQAATLTFVGSTSQLIVTLFAGAFGLIALWQNITTSPDTSALAGFWINGVLAGTFVVLFILVAAYFKISWLVRVLEKIPALQKYTYFIRSLDHFKATQLWYILSLSAIRFSVFLLQYLVLFKLFGVEIPWWQGCCAVAVMFLVLAIIPIPGIAELGIRGRASMALFMSFSNNPVGILVTTGCIWLINIILPAVLGSLLILNVKLFSKNEETA